VHSELRDHVAHFGVVRFQVAPLAGILQSPLKIFFFRAKAYQAVEILNLAFTFGAERQKLLVGSNRVLSVLQVDVNLTEIVVRVLEAGIVLGQDVSRLLEPLYGFIIPLSVIIYAPKVVGCPAFLRIIGEALFELLLRIRIVLGSMVTLRERQMLLGRLG
jgi:hypothetical protein